jgi:periplasmic protein CpxP/Spy
MRKVVAVLTLMLVAGPAFGQAAATAPQAANGAAVETRVNERIAQMHKRLKITPAQDQAWEGFAQVMRGNATSVEQAYRQRAVSVETMSAPENLRNFAQIEQARADGVQKLAASFETLYGSLSGEQKKTADAMFRHYQERGEARRHPPKKPG